MSTSGKESWVGLAEVSRNASDFDSAWAGYRVPWPYFGSRKRWWTLDLEFG